MCLKCVSILVPQLGPSSVHAWLSSPCGDTARGDRELGERAHGDKGGWLILTPSCEDCACAVEPPELPCEPRRISRRLRMTSLVEVAAAAEEAAVDWSMVLARERHLEFGREQNN